MIYHQDNHMYIISYNIYIMYIANISIIYIYIHRCWSVAPFSKPRIPVTAMFTLGFMGYAPISNKPIYEYICLWIYVCVDLAGDLNSDIISPTSLVSHALWIPSSKAVPWPLLGTTGGASSRCDPAASSSKPWITCPPRIEHCEGISTWVWINTY